jgi:hypothetical protein
MTECRERGGSSCKVRAWGCDATKSKAEIIPSPATPPKAVAPALPKVPAQMVKQDNAQPLTPQAINNAFSMMGSWLFDYDSDSGYSATGTMRVTENVGGGSFRGVMTQSYVNSEGIAKRVRQDVIINVRGATVVVNGSNPVYLKGTGIYNPDKYTLNIANPNLLRGTNTDSKGIGG